MLKQVDIPEGSCNPVEHLCWSRVLAEQMIPWTVYTGAVHDVEETCAKKHFYKSSSLL